MCAFRLLLRQTCFPCLEMCLTSSFLFRLQEVSASQSSRGLLYSTTTARSCLVATWFWHCSPGTCSAGEKTDISTFRVDFHGAPSFPSYISLVCPPWLVQVGGIQGGSMAPFKPFPWENSPKPHLYLSRLFDHDSLLCFLHT